MAEHDPCIGAYEHLSSLPRAPEALHSIRKIASLVKPIMRNRGWRVGVLTEFYPAQTNLLGININRGSKICLRLRYPGDQNQFLPVDEVIDTMLHEYVVLPAMTFQRLDLSTGSPTMSMVLMMNVFTSSGTSSATNIKT